MKVYLAGRYERQRELCAVAAELHYLGHEIVSTWLMSTQERTDEKESAEAIAVRNWEDLGKADMVACFTEDPGQPYPGGDRHVEFGIALVVTKLKLAGASVAGPSQLCTVGPKQLTFHSFPGVPNFPNIDCFLLHMRQVQEGA